MKWTGSQKTKTSAEEEMMRRLPEEIDSKDDPSGWLSPRLEEIPRPTYWPVVMALGTIMGLAGIVTAWAISVVGVALLALGLGGWIGEIRHE